MHQLKLEEVDWLLKDMMEEKSTLVDKDAKLYKVLFLQDHK